MDMARDLQAFSAVLDTEGPSAALAWLNHGVPHRYSAAYRFAGPVLRNVLLHDKADQMRPEFLAAVPFDKSYCQYVRRDSAFRTDDSAADSRLEGHAYREVVVSYHSVPLLSPSGELWGTLSHFDAAALPLSDDEFALLEGAARLMAPALADL